ADLNDLHVVLRHAPAAEDDQERRVRHGADARHADLLALDISLTSDLRPGDEPLETAVDDAGYHDGVAAPQVGIDDRIARRGSELDIAGEQRADGHRRGAADDDDLGVQTVFAKKPFLLRHPHRAVDRAYRAQAEADFFLRPRRDGGQDHRRQDRRYRARSFHRLAARTVESQRSYRNRNILPTRI